MVHDRTLEDLRQTVHPLLAKLYGASGKNIEELCDRFVRLVGDQRAKRSEELKEFDRSTNPDWWRSSDTVTYVLYADLFSPEAPAGQKLDAMREQLAYFIELGVNLVHILPILKSSGDAGFAVVDSEHVAEQYGTNDALLRLISEFHRHGIRVALDFVLNHVADTHKWAVAAVNTDDPDHDTFHDFLIWSDSGEPWSDVPDVFPNFAPGHWDYVEKVGAWVWATFYKRRPLGSEQDRFDFAQWDLNWKNPEVLLGMLGYLLNLANWGIDVFRLDAVPHIWKERGTSCTSHPKVHTILKLLHLALQFVAPRTVLLAEACQEFEQLVQYFGEEDEVHVAYHFELMQALWQAVTTGPVADIRKALTRVPRAIDHTYFWVFSEVHDEVSLEPMAQSKARAISRYLLASGGLPFRQRKGEDFPRGISGTTFTLLRRDVRRVLLLWQLKLSLGWTPLFYMGEELGVENNLSYREDPARCEDSRFVKRVALDEDQKNRRHEVGTIESYLFHNLRRFIAWRKQHTCLVQPPDFFETGSSQVLGFSKQNAQERMVVLANCSDEQQTMSIPGLGTKTLKPFEFWWESRSIDG